MAKQDKRSVGFADIRRTNFTRTGQDKVFQSGCQAFITASVFPFERFLNALLGVDFNPDAIGPQLPIKDENGHLDAQ